MNQIKWALLVGATAATTLVGCGGSDSGSTGTGTAGSSGSAAAGKGGAAGKAGSGGTGATGGSTGGTAGSSGKGGTAGSTGGKGGMGGSTGGAAGKAGMGGSTGGAAGAAGKAGSGGSTGGAAGKAGMGGSTGGAAGKAGSGGTAGAAGAAGKAGSGGTAGTAGAAGKGGGAAGIGGTAGTGGMGGAAGAGGAVATCTDSIKNGSETDTDCGGSCSPCGDTKTCAIAGDCASGVCDGATNTCSAPTCSDTVKNGTETATDCGGSCSPCVDGSACAVPGDCVSGVCSNLQCAAAMCNDGVLNGDETAVDCGGSCGPCGVGSACTVQKDCATFLSCSGNVCTTVNSDLLLYWNFDDAVGATHAVDSSGNNLDGNVSANGTFVSGGKQGGAYSFAGAGCIATTFPNTAAQGTGLYIPQGDETFAMWIKTSSASIQGLQAVTADVQCSTGNGWDRIIGDGASDKPQFNVWNEVNFQEPTSLSDGNWHHVAYVIDKANGLFVYIDGSLAAQSTKANGCVNCSDFNWANVYNVGSGVNGRFGAGSFTGLMDEIRVYTKPLSAQQVLDLYNATKLAGESGEFRRSRRNFPDSMLATALGRSGVLRHLHEDCRHDRRVDCAACWLRSWWRDVLPERVQVRNAVLFADGCVESAWPAPRPRAGQQRRTALTTIVS